MMRKEWREPENAAAARCPIYGPKDLQWCGWLNNDPPEDVPALIPEPVNTLPSMVKGTLKKWLTVCTLRWKSYPWLARWTPSIWVGHREMQWKKGKDSKCEMDTPLLSLKMEEVGNEPRNVGILQRLRVVLRWLPGRKQRSHFYNSRNWILPITCVSR